MQYDRTLLRNAAQGTGDKNASAVARRIGVGRMAAWRLWNGHGAPAATTAAAVERAYGVPASALVKPLPEETPA
ncbi:XRE family transcriptional regulator [Streptomyces sp. NPDC091046]|uniref:XRE family transcriptional regulator n=1 Tax=Streptomyces sp. NPDC091046 TaxID=3365973 RepID=UPI0038140117